MKVESDNVRVMPMDKYINEDGKIGVLMSAICGNAGWSTSLLGDDCKFKEMLLMDRSLVQMVINKSYDLIDEYVYKNTEIQGICGLVSPDSLKIIWVDKGQEFKVWNYYGRELLSLIDSSTETFIA